jgi:hypothetical protein
VNLGTLRKYLTPLAWLRVGNRISRENFTGSKGNFWEPPPTPTSVPSTPRELVLEFFIESHVKVSHIVKRSLSCRLLRVSKAHELLHGIRAGSFDSDEHFPPVVKHVFGQR